MKIIKKPSYYEAGYFNAFYAHRRYKDSIHKNYQLGVEDGLADRAARKRYLPGVYIRKPLQKKCLNPYPLGLIVSSWTHYAVWWRVDPCDALGNNLGYRMEKVNGVKQWVQIWNKIDNQTAV